VANSKSFSLEQCAHPKPNETPKPLPSAHETMSTMLLNDRATAPEVVEGESQPEQTPSCIASIEPCGTLNLACRSIIRLDPLIHFEKLLGCVLSVDERSVFKVATTNNQLCARFN